MALIVSALLLFAAGPFILWPLLRTPPDDEGIQKVTSPPAGKVARVAPDGEAE
jgi:hypothetical protein